jgi:hypothetical protein
MTWIFCSSSSMLTFSDSIKFVWSNLIQYELLLSHFLPYLCTPISLQLKLERNLKSYSCHLVILLELSFESNSSL